MRNQPEQVVHGSGDRPNNGQPAAELARRLSLLDSIAIVVGITIGGGIFLVPNLVARSLPAMPSIMAVWLVAGGISLIGALACAELGAA